MPTSRQHNTSPTSTADRSTNRHGTPMSPQYGDIGADRSIMQSGDLSRATERIQSIFDNRNVSLGQGARQGESPQDRIARIADEIVTGQRTFGDVRQSVDRLAGSSDFTATSQQRSDPDNIYRNIGADWRIMSERDPDQIMARITDIFDNRGVDMSYGAREGETAEQRLLRLMHEVETGARSFGDIRRSVDMLAGNDDHTRESGGQDPVVSPTIPGHLLAELDREYQDASNLVKEALATEEEEVALAEAQAQLNLEQLASQYEQMRRQGARGLGGAGLAFQPAGIGRQTRDFNQRETADVGQVEGQLAIQVQELANMVSQARRERERRHTAVDDRRAALEAELALGELADFGNY